jgi:hypothetical protein
VAAYEFTTNGRQVNIRRTASVDSYSSGSATGVAWANSGAFFACGDRCLWFNGSTSHTQLDPLPDIPEELQPVSVACDPSGSAEVQGVFVGWGPFAYAITPEQSTWRRRRIAPNTERFGAQGVAFLNQKIYIGWRSDELFAFELPTTAPEEDEADTLSYVANWSPSPRVKIVTVHILPTSKAMHVYVTPRV